MRSRATNEALAIARELGDQANEFVLLTGLGPAYDALHEYDRAFDAYTQALTVARKRADRRQEALALTQLGFVSSLQRRFDRALDYYTQALPITPRAEG